MYRVLVRITLRPSILDPQGKAVAHALGELGLADVAEVRTGKSIALTVRAGSEGAARATATAACEKLLANPVTETFEVVEVEALDGVPA